MLAELRLREKRGAHFAFTPPEGHISVWGPLEELKRATRIISEPLP
jgi:hypothetical protein